MVVQAVGALRGREPTLGIGPRGPRPPSPLRYTVRDGFHGTDITVVRQGASGPSPSLEPPDSRARPRQPGEGARDVRPAVGAGAGRVRLFAEPVLGRGDSEITERDQRAVVQRVTALATAHVATGPCAQRIDPLPGDPEGSAPQGMPRRGRLVVSRHIVGSRRFGARVSDPRLLETLQPPVTFRSRALACEPPGRGGTG